MSRTHFKLVAAVAVFLLVLPVVAQNQMAGKLSAVKGKVSLVRGQSMPVPLHNGDNIQSGDAIWTDAMSSATLRFPDRSTVRIFPNSHVELRPESSSWKEFLHLLLGNVRVQIEKLSGRPNPKVMTTPTAIIAVRGTIFAVAVERNGDTQVGLEKGVVAVASQFHPEEEVLLHPGQELWVRHGEALGQPRRMQRPMPGLAAPNSSGFGQMGPRGSGANRPTGTGRQGPSR